MIIANILLLREPWELSVKSLRSLLFTAFAMEFARLPVKKMEMIDSISPEWESNHKPSRLHTDGTSLRHNGLWSRESGRLTIIANCKANCVDERFVGSILIWEEWIVFTLYVYLDKYYAQS